jgi:phosphatidylinositol dimannoside acyltransferase
MSVPAAATERAAMPRGTVLQRTRVNLLAIVSWVACRLPNGAIEILVAVVGGAWYRVTPRRAARARRNLARVAGDLAKREDASATIRAAATDPRALEALVRSAYRHAVRYYLDMIRVPAVGERMLRERLVIETPDVVEQAFARGRPVIFVGLHYGAIELPALYLTRRTRRITTVPMETLADQALQQWILRTRSRAGLRIVGLAEARRELRAALERGESIGLIGDRDLTGNGIPIELFGRPARLPAGPALLALESGAPVFVGAVRRGPGGTWRGRLREIPVPHEGPRRERLIAVLEAIAGAFEDAIALAPDQWWTVFYPIWDDLEEEGREQTGDVPGGRKRGPVRPDDLSAAPTDSPPGSDGPREPR